MKVLLLAMNSPGYAELAAITDATKDSYARRWGYDSEFIVDATLGGPRGAWRRVELWQEALAKCRWMLFTGTDAAITNPKISLVDRFHLEDTTADFIVSADGNGLQSDSWIMRSCDRTRRFLDRVLMWEDVANNEQDAINIELSKSNSYRSFCHRIGDLKQNGEPIGPEMLEKLELELNRSEVVVKIVPQQLINAYPNQIYGKRIAGGDNQWTPTSFVIHIPGQTNETRIAFLKTIL